MDITFGGSRGRKVEQGGGAVTMRLRFLRLHGLKLTLHDRGGGDTSRGPEVAASPRPDTDDTVVALASIDPGGISDSEFELAARRVLARNRR